MKQIELTPQEEAVTRIVNYDEVKKTLTEELERFGDVIYIADTNAEAKKDRSYLNQIRASLERTMAVLHTRRKNAKGKIALESVIAAERQVAELLHMLDHPHELVQEFLEYRSEELKKERRRDLMNYANSVAAELGEIGKMIISSIAFWDERWDMQSMSLKKCRGEIKHKINDSAANIAAFRKEENSSALILKYLETLNIDNVLEYKKRLDMLSGIQPILHRDDNVIGYKTVKISGRAIDVERIIDQIELMGADFEILENGIPGRPTERREPNFDSFVAFDFETSGSLGVGSGDLPPEITEIGAVKVENGVVVETFSELCNPGRRITPTVVGLTGITDEMVEDKPPAREVVRRFCEFIGDHIIVGHGIKDSDLIYLERDARRDGIALTNQYFDTYRFSKKFKDRLKLDGLGLEALAKQLDVPQPQAHRALADANVTVGVYHALRDRSKNRA